MGRKSVQSNTTIKTEVSCLICNESEGNMESIPCKATNKKLIRKIYNCTDKKVTPVNGMISPVCEKCFKIIDSADDNGLFKTFQEFVIKAEVNDADLNYDPFSGEQAAGGLNYECKVVPIEQPNFSGSNLLGSTKRKKAEKSKIIEKNIKAKEKTEEVSNVKDEENSNWEWPKETTSDKTNKPSQEKIENPFDENLDVKEDNSDWEWPEQKPEEVPSEKRSTREKILEKHNDGISDDDGKNQGDSDWDSSEDTTKKKKRSRTIKIPKIKEKCKICEKEFNNIQNHMKKIHDEKKRYQCKQCERTFNTDGALRYHIKTHSGERPFKCELCGKTYISKNHLNMHMNTHSEEKRYQCHICSKSFNQSFKLSEHLKTHTGLKPHACEICGKSFLKKNTRDVHVKRHSGEKTRVCDICSKSFFSNSALNRHLKIHEKAVEKKSYFHLNDNSPFKCDVCGKGFSKTKYMSQHRKRHFELRVQGKDKRLLKEPGSSDTEDFNCTYCPKRFSVSEAFEKHVKGHERYIASQKEFKPFKCGLCDKSYSKDKYLKEHHNKKHLEKTKVAENQPNTLNIFYA